MPACRQFYSTLPPLTRTCSSRALNRSLRCRHTSLICKRFDVWFGTLHFATMESYCKRSQRAREQILPRCWHPALTFASPNHCCRNLLRVMEVGHASASCVSCVHPMCWL